MFLVTKFFWQKKCYFEGTANQKYTNALEIFLSKSKNIFEK